MGAMTSMSKPDHTSLTWPAVFIGLATFPEYILLGWILSNSIKYGVKQLTTPTPAITAPVEAPKPIKKEMSS